MKAKIDIQLASEQPHPDIKQLQSWAQLALHEHPNSEMTLRLVDREEIHQLNHTYRHKDAPTNVLSFPSDLPDYLDIALLGDVVICNDVVNQEAQEQNKPHDAHWAHMVIHGCLHLLGYDHIEESDAQIMEHLECQLLAQLGYTNPYEES